MGRHRLACLSFPDVLVELDASVSGVELQIDGIVVPLTSSDRGLHGATPATIHVGSEIRLRYDKGPDTAARIQLEDQSCVEARNACDGGGA